MNNSSFSSFYTNISILFKKKLIFLPIFAISFSIFFILINYIIQSSAPKQSHLLITLNNNQKELINNYFFIKNINKSFDDIIDNDIIKTNLPPINIDEIINDLSLNINTNYLDFLENSINYSFYLENNIVYLKDDDLINKKLPIIKNFHKIKETALNFKFEKFDEKVMRVKVFTTDTSNIKNNRDILLEFFKTCRKYI